MVPLKKISIEIQIPMEILKESEKNSRIFILAQNIHIYNLEEQEDSRDVYLSGLTACPQTIEFHQNVLYIKYKGDSKKQEIFIRFKYELISVKFVLQNYLSILDS